jgi:hypothetical protein
LVPLGVSKPAVAETYGFKQPPKVAPGAALPEQVLLGAEYVE